MPGRGRDRRIVSARRWSTAAVAGWRRRHDLPGESAPGRDNDQLPVTSADGEGSGVSLLEDSQDVGDNLTAISGRPAPPDHDPLADIGGGEPDLKPVAHVGSLLAGWATFDTGKGWAKKADARARWRQSYSDIEPELDDVAVTHDIVLALDPGLASRPGRRDRSRLHQVIK